MFVNASCAVAAIITDQQGRILLTRRAHEPWKGCLDLPGGFVDPGETAEEALHRELMEELNVRITIVNYFCSAANEYEYAGVIVPTIDLAYICTIDHRPQPNNNNEAFGIVPSDDVSSIEWLAKADIDLNAIPSPSIRNIIKQYLLR